MSMAPTTRYKISIELCRTKLLSLTFSFGAQGQGFQQLGLKFSIFQFFLFLTGLPVRANSWWKESRVEASIYFSSEVFKTLFTGMETFNPEAKENSYI